MGKPHNKSEKRNRRKAYLKRKNELMKSAVKTGKTSSQKAAQPLPATTKEGPVKKAATKKAAAKKAPAKKAPAKKAAAKKEAKSED